MSNKPNQQQPEQPEEEPFSVRGLVESGLGRLVSAVVRPFTDFVSELSGGARQGWKDGYKAGGRILGFLGAVGYGVSGIFTGAVKGFVGIFRGLLEKPDFEKIIEDAKANYNNVNAANWARGGVLAVGAVGLYVVLGVPAVLLKIASRGIAGVGGSIAAFLKKTFVDSIYETYKEAEEKVKNTQGFWKKLGRAALEIIPSSLTALGRMAARIVWPINMDKKVRAEKGWFKWPDAWSQAGRSAVYGFKNGIEGGGLFPNFLTGKRPIFPEEGSVRKNLKQLLTVEAVPSSAVKATGKQQKVPKTSIPQSSSNQNLRTERLLRAEKATSQSQTQFSGKGNAPITPGASASAEAANQKQKLYGTVPPSLSSTSAAINNLKIDENQAKEINKKFENQNLGKIVIDNNIIKISGAKPIEFVVAAQIQGPFTLNIAETNKIPKTTAKQMISKAKDNGIVIDRVTFGKDVKGNPQEFLVKTKANGDPWFVKRKPDEPESFTPSAAL